MKVFLVFIAAALVLGALAPNRALSQQSGVARRRIVTVHLATPVAK